MPDRKLYCNACDRLTLDAEKIEEMIMMTENTKDKPVRRPFRVVLVAAALVAALGITASAAGIPAVQEFFASVFVTVTVTDGTFEDLAVPTMAVEKRDGRTILILDEEEIDVTDTLAEMGEYLYKGENYEVRVDAEGVAVLTAYSADGESVLSFSTGPNVGGDLVSYNVIADGEAGDVDMGVYTIVADEAMGSVNVIDEAGQVRNYQVKDGQLVPAE